MTNTMIADAEKNAAWYAETLGHCSREAIEARRRVENLKDRKAEVDRDRARHEATKAALAESTAEWAKYWG
jgi:hypothetical protein